MKSVLEGSVTDSMEAHFAGLTAENLLHWAMAEFGETLAVSTSFGIQSSVMLKLATAINPDVQVIWVDTGYLPAETYAYATTLTRQLKLNLKVYEPRLTPFEMESKHGKLWESDRMEDLNLYDQIRKVEPMQRALDELGVLGWVSGLRANQTDYRKRLPPIKRTGTRFRVYPILEWTNRDVYHFMTGHGLPQHPLFDQGYTTVGDAHSSRPLSMDDSDDRDTRFRGIKQECGLHVS